MSVKLTLILFGKTDKPATTTRIPYRVEFMMFLMEITYDRGRRTIIVLFFEFFLLKRES